MSIRNKLHILLALAAGTLLSLTACTDNSQSGNGASASGAEATPPTPSREIVIEANDQMKFDTERFVVAPGETVKLTLKNVGTMPKFSMGHNVVVLKRGVNVDSYAEAAASAPTTDYVPSSMDSKVVTHTKLLGGGETDSVIFTAPNVRAEYPFLCTFPGHLQAGMRGVMKVQ